MTSKIKCAKCDDVFIRREQCLKCLHPEAFRNILEKNSILSPSLSKSEEQNINYHLRDGYQLSISNKIVLIEGFFNINGASNIFSKYIDFLKTRLGVINIQFNGVEGKNIYPIKNFEILNDDINLILGIILKQ